MWNPFREVALGPPPDRPAGSSGAPTIALSGEFISYGVGHVKTWAPPVPVPKGVKPEATDFAMNWQQHVGSFGESKTKVNVTPGRGNAGSGQT